MKTSLVIATRGSQLALWQAEHVRSRLLTLRPDLSVELLKIKTKGDVILVAGKGHEDYQEVQGVKHHFDDRELIRELFTAGEV